MSPQERGIERLKNFEAEKQAIEWRQKQLAKRHKAVSMNIEAVQTSLRSLETPNDVAV